MATRTAILAVRVVTDATAGRRGLAQTEKGVKSLSDAADKAAVPAAALAVAVGLIYKQAGDAASALQQSTGAVESVFQGYAGAVKDAAKAASQSVGLAQSEYGNLATVIGSQLKNMGIPMEAVAGQTQDLIGLGADLAATFGGTTSEAVSALSSLLRGERDPIERYGVSINQAAVNAKLAEMGLSGLTGEAQKNANLQATLALLTEQTSAAQGQFAREADTAAGAQQRANAEWENAKAAVGTSFLPIMALAADALAQFSQFAADNTELVTFLILTLGTFAGALGVLIGVTKAYQIAQEALTIAQLIFNAAATANPIGLIIVAVGLLVAGIALLIANWETVADVGSKAIRRMIEPFQPLIDKVVWFLELLRQATGAFLGLQGFAGFEQPNPQFPDSRTMTLRSIGVMSRAAAVEPEGSNSAPVRAAAASRSGAAAVAGKSGGDTYNSFTINGAIDKDSTARQIKGLLNSQATRNGGRAAGGRVVS